MKLFKYIIPLLIILASQTVSGQFLWRETHESHNFYQSFRFREMSSYGNSIAVNGYLIDSLNQSLYPKLWSSTNGGDLWREWDIDLVTVPYAKAKSSTFFDLCQVDDDNIYVVGFYIDLKKYFPQSDSSILIRTRDGGRHWERGGSIVGASLTRCHFSDSLNGIVIAANIQYDGYKRIIGGPDQDIYTSTDGGDSFILAKGVRSTYFTDCFSYGAGKFRVFNSRNGKIFSTTDSWNSVDSTSSIVDLDVLPLYSFLGCDFGGDTLVAYGWYSADGTFTVKQTEGVITRSTNGGKSWGKVHHFPEFYSLNDAVTPNRDTIFSAGKSATGKAIYLQSVNNGVSWSVEDMALDSGSSFNVDRVATTSSGVPLSIVTIDSTYNTTTIIAQGRLMKNTVKKNDVLAHGMSIVPNPAYQSIVICSDHEIFSVEILDICGRVVYPRTTLSNGASINIERLPAGVYTVSTARNGEYTASKLIKQ